MSTRTCIILGAVALVAAGCQPKAPGGSLVLTQTPVQAEPLQNTTLMDVRYPHGSRVLLLAPPFGRDSVLELSRGLVAAGDPCVSWDGRWVYFAGKSSDEAIWQIYRVNSGGGLPELVTRMPGGAMGPAIAAHGQLVFSSPVPKAGHLSAAQEPAALYGQMPGHEPYRLTFGPDNAVDATVLRDGRILYVSARARDNYRTPKSLGLFTINNDGTEVTAYACQGDGADFVQRPRELDDGRIAFLTAHSGEGGSMAWAESVKSAAPFATRGSLFKFGVVGIRSVEPTAGGEVLASAETRSGLGRSMTGNAKIFRVAAGDASLSTPLVDDPLWNSIEAMGVAERPEPSGHTTAIMPASHYGTVVCLNVNDSSEPAAEGNLAPAAELRVFVPDGPGLARTLGTIPVDADGSVILRLPADVPLGLETLDAQGHVLRHQPPSLWLRPGENRACIGCHEPRNHAPRNIRPLATMHGPAHLELTSQTSAAHAATP